MSMFKLLPSLAVALAVTSVLTLAARANEPGIPRSERLFGRLDANADGRLAIDEMRPKAERRFLRLDTDGDGKVTTAEIEAWLQKIQDRRRDRILQRMDFDKDGAVTKEEVDTYLEKLFATADGDQDGGVTLVEAQAYHSAKAKRTFLKDGKGKQEQP
jgi:Ca2+-binding EF-hand superfamily protein